MDHVRVFHQEEITIRFADGQTETHLVDHGVISPAGVLKYTQGGYDYIFAPHAWDQVIVGEWQSAYS